MDTLIKPYKDPFFDYLSQKKIIKSPTRLYEPIAYILQLGGKRLRPILALMTCDLFGKDFKKAYDAALAIEVFHNFTLIHDDIMDSASIRRGKTTVHKKWDVNTGILSGDAMMIMAYRFLESYEPVLFKKLMPIFSKTAIEVCEGQQLDIDFETRNDVTITEYIQMITLKTSVLIGASMKIGSIIANASKQDADYIYNFGLNLGIAFQLQDDYLDTFGDTSTFGKKIGGDILENKKTFLYLSAIEKATYNDKKHLQKLYSTNPKNEDKINEVTAIFKKYNIEKCTQNEIEKYTQKAFSVLEKTSLGISEKQIFVEFGKKLMERLV